MFVHPQEKDTFYKQPMYYALGHFSKFVERGAKSIYHSLMSHNTSDHLSAAAFLNTEGRAVMVLLNT